MQLIAKVKLQPTEEQSQALLETLETANAACNHISDVAWRKQVFGRFSLQKEVYYGIKDRFGLSAQATIHCVRKVADAYKLDQATKRTFSQHGAIPYDRRILSWKLAEQTVSIWTVQGRQRMPFLTGERQLELLRGERGESDLCYIDKEFYLFTSCEVDEPTPDDVSEFLGVDFGIKNIAVDSDGNVHSSSALNNVRERYARQRAQLQSKRTKSAKRKLKNLSGKEARFRQDANHCISKELVQLAKGTGRGIALEDLSGIRDRVTVRHSQRRLHHSWAFYDLRQKIEYKAELAGVPIVLVDPRNTSRICPMCGCADKRNRPNQATFHCVQCDFSGHADHIAAINIAQKAIDSRAAITQPAV